VAVSTSARAEPRQKAAVSPARLVRWSGAGTILAGVLLALFPLLHPNHDPVGYRSPVWIPVHAMAHVGLLLLLFGLVGLLARQLDRAGRLGVAGFVAAFVGTAMQISGAQVELFVFPFLGLNAPQLLEGEPPAGFVEMQMLTGLAILVGFVVLGVATARAAVLPRGVGVLLAIGGAAFVVGQALNEGPTPAVPAAFTMGAGLFGVALVWLGYALWADPAREPRAVARGGYITA
jgi:hypothetical protein